MQTYLTGQALCSEQKAGFVKHPLASTEMQLFKNNGVTPYDSPSMQVWTDLTCYRYFVVLICQLTVKTVQLTKSISKHFYLTITVVSRNKGKLQNIMTITTFSRTFLFAKCAYFRGFSATMRQ